MTPERAMRMALAEARRAEGRCFPNPPVGAIVYRGDRVLGRGRTRPAGGPHAEVVALERALRRFGRRAVRGASMAVTLEPCCHRGRTGPCTEAIREAGLSRVAVGHRDPNPEVSGRGLRQLRAAGIAVLEGVLEPACRHQHRGFLCWVERRRPFVALKLATSLDGRIATSRGESRWITGPEARALVHRLRDRSDAVMVGPGTARADDPSLDVRRGGRIVRTPVRVLVDARLEVPTRARLFREQAARTWVLAGPGTSERRRSSRQAAGARVLIVPVSAGRLNLRRALGRLAREGLTTLLVEGGAGLAAALLREQLVDEVHWFTGPCLIGGDGSAALEGLGVSRLAERVGIDVVELRRVGGDLYLHGSVVRRPRAKGRGGRR